jgi:hypothetical protein
VVKFDKEALRSQKRCQSPARTLVVTQDPTATVHAELDGRGECKQLSRLLSVEKEYVLGIPAKLTPMTRYQVLQVLCALSPHFNTIQCFLGDDFSADLAALVSRRASGSAASFGFFL